LQSAAVLPLAYAIPGLAPAQEGGGQPAREAPFHGLIVRQHQPENLEFPFSTLDRFIIPNERFYVRSHFEVPRVDMAAWRLRVEGAVERPLELTLNEVRAFTSATVTA